MKITIILIVLSILLAHCETRKEKEHRKENSHFNEVWTFFIVGDVYAFYNICPPVSKVFDPGTYDISLEKGEALYFDISPRLKPELDNWDYNYYIGISKEASADIAMNALFTCRTNKMFSDPKPMRTANDSSYDIYNTDTEFAYYKYSMYRTKEIILTAKAVKSTTKFKLKIPQNGER